MERERRRVVGRHTLRSATRGLSTLDTRAASYRRVSASHRKRKREEGAAFAHKRPRTNCNGRGAATDDADIARARVVVLMLAHDGVHQPAVWERWRAEAPPRLRAQLAFRVFANRGAPAREPFVARHLLTSWLPTTWGDFSLVDALQAALRELAAATDDFANLHLLAFVSGACVPVKPAATLFALPATTRLSTYDASPLVDRCRTLLDSAGLGPWPEPGSLVLHDQWLLLDAAAAHGLARFDFDRLRQLDAALTRDFQATLSARPASGRLVPRNPRSTTWFVPDSFAVGTALRHLRLPFAEAAVTYECRPRRDLGSPVEWQTPDDVHPVLGHPARLSFAEALALARRDPDCLFFRKVARSRALGSALLA